MNNINSIRKDWKLIESLIDQNSRILDIGCGQGSLIEKLEKNINAKTHGIELNPELVGKAISKGLNVIHGNAEKDLIRSLEILPDQAHVLNYLSYSWIDQGINLDKGLEMLKKADKLRENDGYIIDSLGWAYYVKENYTEAELFLQRAVELMPSDPVINDHYADALWMLKKNIQARYVWNYILKLNNTEQKLKDTISKKLIFGIKKKL